MTQSTTERDRRMTQSTTERDRRMTQSTTERDRRMTQSTTERDRRMTQSTTEREGQRDRHRKTNSKRQTDRDRHTQTQTNTQSGRQTEQDRQRQRSKASQTTGNAIGQMSMIKDTEQAHGWDECTQTERYHDTLTRNKHEYDKRHGTSTWMGWMYTDREIPWHTDNTLTERYHDRLTNTLTERYHDRLTTHWQRYHDRLTTHWQNDTMTDWQHTDREIPWQTGKHIDREIKWGTERNIQWDECYANLQQRQAEAQQVIMQQICPFTCENDVHIMTVHLV